MPELPEVETIKSGISPHILNQKIADTIIRQHSLRWPIPKTLKKQLLNAQITNVTRRAKYILIDTDSKGSLIVHLGMSGTIKVVDHSTELKKHDHVDILLKNNKILRYNDPRRFGALLWLDAPYDQHPIFKHLGPEPLTDAFNLEYMSQKAQKRKVPVKNFIMDNKIVVGVGNIYATESLFFAGINPLKPVNEISRSDLEKLTLEIKRILTNAIKLGGTTLKDFVQADGKPGYFKQELAAYGRAGESCRKCKQTLESIRQQGRTTVFCSNCQK